MKKIVLFLFVLLTITGLLGRQAFAAFTASVTDTTVFGPKLVKYGTYTGSGGGTGGDIVTNLNVVQGCYLQPKAAAVIATQSVVNETFPLVNSTGAVTIVTSADEVGYFWCFGF